MAKHRTVARTMMEQEPAACEGCIAVKRGWAGAVASRAQSQGEDTNMERTLGGPSLKGAMAALYLAAQGPLARAPLSMFLK